MKLDFVERARAIGAQARSAADARGTTKLDPNAVKPGDPSPQVPRDWWTVYRWGGEVVQVLVREPQTQREMRALYPEAAGVIAPDS